MTLQDMLDQVSDEIRNVSITSKITRWLNMGIINIASSYIFTELNKYVTTNTSPSLPIIYLEPDVLWLKTVGIPLQNRKLWPTDETTLAKESPNYRTLQGTVTHYYITGEVAGVALGLRHVPSAIENIAYSYQKRPIKLVSPTDVSDLPEEWHTLIAQKAITKGYSYEGNIGGKDSSLLDEKILLKTLGANKYRRLDETLVQGSNSISRRGIPYIKDRVTQGWIRSGSGWIPG